MLHNKVIIYSGDDVSTDRNEAYPEVMHIYHQKESIGMTFAWDLGVGRGGVEGLGVLWEGGGGDGGGLKSSHGPHINLASLRLADFTLPGDSWRKQFMW